MLGIGGLALAGLEDIVKMDLIPGIKFRKMKIDVLYLLVLGKGAQLEIMGGNHRDGPGKG